MSAILPRQRRLAGFLALAGIAAACGSTSSEAPGDELSLGAGSGGFDPNDACALYQLTAVPKPVNLYVLFDKSQSMAGSKWDNAEKGFGTFASAASSAGLNVGLRFFPREPDDTPVCDPKPYQQPTVPVLPLPANAGAMKQAIADEEPNGFGTPMYPALGGGLLAGIALAKANPGSVSAVLLVSDGVPEGPAASCAGVNPSDPAEVAKLAKSGAAYDPPVVTYVVGLPGVDPSSANLIAEAGGSDAAIFVTGDVADSFQQALAKVRGDVLPCRYDLPEQVIDGAIALTLVNIEVSHGADTALVPYDPKCSGDGWRYDDLEMPSAIVLCAKTCAELKADKNAAIEVVLGCGTRVL